MRNKSTQHGNLFDTLLAGDAINSASSIRVRDLSGRIKSAIDKEFRSESIWVEGEILDLRYQFQSDTYYFLLTDKDEQSDKVVASVKATIWKNNAYQVLQFEKTTGHKFSNRLKVLLKCTVSYHVQYGLSVNVFEINPEYTIGNLALSRQYTLEQLVLKVKGISVKDGVYNSPNKALPWPKQIKRIALLTASGSDAELDFMHEINSSSQFIGYSITHHPIQMGVEAIERVTKTLQTIAATGQYDVIAIVRGGGSDAEMLAYDSYHLAKAIAEFPIPVIIGVGHERNLSICDLLTAVSVKTPTKAAAYINDYNLKSLADVEALTGSVSEIIKKRITEREQWIIQMDKVVRIQIDKLYIKELNKLDALISRIRERVSTLYHESLLKVELLTNNISALDPDFYLQRGFALLVRDHKIITSATQLSKNDLVEIKFKDGSREATIN